MKTIAEHMEELGLEAREIDYRKLSKLYGNDVKSRREEDLRREADFETGLGRVQPRHIDLLRKAVEEALVKEADEINGEFPIISTFDALQLAKTAFKKNSRDVGLSNLVTFLERKWEKNKSANLITADLLKMKDHFKRSYPKSAAKEVIEEFSKKGYSTLPVADLCAIADKIRSQDDFDYYIKEAGLHTNNPFARKARRFILGIVNGEESEEENL